MSSASTRGRKSSTADAGKPPRQVPSWVPRVRWWLEVLSTGGGALLTKKPQPAPHDKPAA